jgi:hypothetical protein
MGTYVQALVPKPHSNKSVLYTCVQSHTHPYITRVHSIHIYIHIHIKKDPFSWARSNGPLQMGRFHGAVSKNGPFVMASMHTDLSPPTTSSASCSCFVPAGTKASTRYLYVVFVHMRI